MDRRSRRVERYNGLPNTELRRGERGRSHCCYSVINAGRLSKRVRQQVLRSRCRDEDGSAVPGGGVFDQRRQSRPHAELPRQTIRRVTPDTDPSVVDRAVVRGAHRDLIFETVRPASAPKDDVVDVVRRAAATRNAAQTPVALADLLLPRHAPSRLSPDFHEARAHLPEALAGRK
jgi:hypothetical protein